MLTGNHSANRVRSFVERIESLEAEKKQIADDIRDVKEEAKANGFDVKVIVQMIKERRMSSAQRREWAAICDVYRAQLGMLDGTPLGESARRRAMGEEPEETTPDDEQDAPDGGAPESDIASAQAAGRQAFQEGLKIIENPFVAGDPRRAAWDEGWCEASGSDGMEIPRGWRRQTPRKGKSPEQPPGGGNA